MFCERQFRGYDDSQILMLYNNYFIIYPKKTKQNGLKHQNLDFRPCQLEINQSSSLMNYKLKCYFQH